MPEASVPTVAPSAPDVERPRRVRWFLERIPPRWHPFLILLAGAAAAVFVRFCLQFHLPLPFCLLRATTGLPCPACGSTRSLAAWTHADPLTALRLNPLFFFVALGLILWAAASVTDSWFGTRHLLRLRVLWSRLSNPWVLLTLMLLNWLYVCLTLPK